MVGEEERQEREMRGWGWRIYIHIYFKLKYTSRTFQLFTTNLI